MDDKSIDVPRNARFMAILGLVLGVASLFTGFGWGLGVALSISGLVLSFISMRRGVRWALAGVIVGTVGVAFCVILPVLGWLAWTFLPPTPGD
ncbi:MAG: hypothetical protein K9H50_02915 [Aurantimicrobium sp.]|nr:hypothetical protein [Aurantimicrobium sp.]